MNRLVPLRGGQNPSESILSVLHVSLALLAFDGLIVSEGAHSELLCEATTFCTLLSPGR